MQRVAVTSSNIAEIGWSDGVLEILFKNGGIYQYNNVPPEVHAALMAADSKGGFLAHGIRGIYSYVQVQEEPKEARLFAHMAHAIEALRREAEARGSFDRRWVLIATKLEEAEVEARMEGAEASAVDGHVNSAHTE